MPGFDGNGNYTRVHNWQQDAANGVDINAAEMDAEDNTIAGAFNNTLTRDGQGKATADLTPATAGVYNLGTALLPWSSLNGIPIAQIPRYPQTGAEAVAPVNLFYPPGNSFRYGVKGDGVTDDTTALQHFFNAVTAGGYKGQWQSGNSVVAAALVITIGTKGFSIEGPSSGSCSITVASSFTTGTVALQLKGTGTNVDFRLGGFSIVPSSGGSGTATTGFLIGDPTTTTAINLEGYNYAQIFQIMVREFATNWRICHARQITFDNCGGWTLGSGIGQNTILQIDQQGSATGDMVFNQFQAVTTNANANTCLSIISTVGPFNIANGNGSVAGIKFNDCQFYSGFTCLSLSAAASAWISDIWFNACQVDQATNQCFNATSLNTGSTIIDIHLNDSFFNGSTAASIVLSSTGSGGNIDDVWIRNNWIAKAQLQAITVFGVLVGDVHILDNSIVDCNFTTGAAIEINGGVVGVTVNGNRAHQGAFGWKPLHLITFDSGIAEITCLGNGGYLNVNGSLVLDNSGAVQKNIDKNLGYNPLGPQTITVTASPFSFENTTGAALAAPITGGTVSAVTVNGISVATATGCAPVVPHLGTIVVTYSSAPTMHYYGL